MIQESKEKDEEKKEEEKQKSGMFLCLSGLLSSCGDKPAKLKKRLTRRKRHVRPQDGTGKKSTENGAMFTGSAAPARGTLPEGPPTLRKPPNWRDFQQTPATARPQRQKPRPVDVGDLRTAFEASGRTRNDKSEKSKPSFTRRIAARIHRTRSQIMIRDANITDKDLTVNLGETNPQDLSMLRRKDVSDGRLYLDDTRRKVSKWLEDVEPGAPLHDLDFAKGSGEVVEIPDELSNGIHPPHQGRLDGAGTLPGAIPEEDEDEDDDDLDRSGGARRKTKRGDIHRLLAPLEVPWTIRSESPGGDHGGGGLGPRSRSFASEGKVSLKSPVMSLSAAQIDTLSSVPPPGPPPPPSVPLPVRAGASGDSPSTAVYTADV